MRRRQVDDVEAEHARQQRIDALVMRLAADPSDHAAMDELDEIEPIALYMLTLTDSRIGDSRKEQMRARWQKTPSPRVGL